MPRESFGHRVIRSLALTFINLIVVIAVIAGVIALAMNRTPEVDDGSWLVLDLHTELPAYDPPGAFPGNLLAQTPLTLQTALDALAKAAVDERTTGVIWKVSAGHGTSWGKLQELRDGIRAVRDAGKPVYAWSPSLDLRSLYLAAACDSLFMPGGGYCQVRGMSRESLHLRETLAKLGVEPWISKIREYKSAAELVTETEMTPEAEAQAQRLLDATWQEVTAAVATGRGITEADLRAFMAQGAQRPTEAAQAGVVDRLLYWQDLEAQLLAAAEDGDDERQSLPTVSAAQYREIPWQDLGREGEETIAMVHAQGMIMGRDSGVNPLLGITMGHRSVVRELRRARLDEEVAAIVLRLDSPGGDAMASDLIGHEVALCAAAKPTVVSMVGVGASGGYQVSFRASHMLANPLARVGSIGSISGIFNARELYDHLGVGKDHVTAGPMASLGRDDRAPTDAEWEAFTSNHEADFRAWLEEVAERRGYTWEEAEQVAYGRVFTGREAVANGLIDGLGNVQDAVRKAAALAEIPPETPLRVVHLPEPRNPVEQVLGGSQDDGPVASALPWLTYRQLREQARTTLQWLQHAPAATWQ
jgi:protease-4